MKIDFLKVIFRSKSQVTFDGPDEWVKRWILSNSDVKKSKVGDQSRGWLEGDSKAPFSIATTPRCRGGRNSFPRIAPFYLWSLPYNAEC